MASSRWSRRIATMFFLFYVMVCAGSAHASYSLTFQGYVQTLNTGGSITLSNPSGIAVDAAGDTFIADTGNNQIVEVTAYGVASVVPISGLSAPAAIAIDGSGNLYIADTGNSRVVKVSPSGSGSVIDTGSVVLSAPKGVALDQAGDLFIADTGNNQIVEVPSGGSASALTITVSSGSSTLSRPKGLAVDISGKLYIADSSNNRIVRVAAGSTTGVVLSTGDVTLSRPSSVAVDRIGNVYIADTCNNRIAEIDTAGNGNVQFAVSNASMSLNAPLGVAVDVFGAVYIADTGDNLALIVDPDTNEDPTNTPFYTSSLNKSAVGFGHIPLGSTSAFTLTLPFTTGSDMGLGAVKVLTSGAQNLDFTVVSGDGTTCDGTTPSSTACTVEVSFLPTAPGLRTGAVVLYDTEDNVILTLPLYGYGDAPVAALSPNAGTVISTGDLSLSNPYQIALDGAGNMYVASYSGKTVTRIAAGGGSASLVNLGTPGSIAVQNITGVAVDGAGNLFIGDHQNSRILVVTPNGVVSVLNITGLSPLLGFPTALAFDASGNLYIADFTNGRIVEVSTIQVTGSTATGDATVIPIGTYSFTGSTLTGLTIDSQGNLYAAARTQNNSSIIKVTASGVVSALAIPNNITPAISNPQGVATDAMGNVYIVDTANKRIVKITTAGVASVLSLSGLPNPSNLSSLLFGVTVDPFANLYIPDWTNNRIVFVNVSGGALTYASTNQGQTSSDSPKTATVTNLGNLPLLFSADPTYTADFSSNSNDGNPCTSATSLLPGTLCDVSVNFTPQSAGSLSAGITVTNNALNVAGNTQQVSVSGTGVNPGDTTSTSVAISPTSLVIGQPVTLTATVADTADGHSSNSPSGLVTFTDTVGSAVVSLNNGASVNLNNKTASLTGVVLSGVGTHIIAANYAGSAGQYLTSSGSATVVVGKASVTLTGPATQPVAVAFGQAGSATFTATPPYPTNPVPAGTLSYTILNSSGSGVASGTLTLTPGSGSSTATVPIPDSLLAGSHILTVTFTPTDAATYTTTTAQVSLTVGQAGVAVTLSSSSSSVVLTNPLLFTATVSSATTTPTGTVSFLDGTTPLGQGTLSNGVATLSVSSLTAGSHTITAVYSGDSNFNGMVSGTLTELVLDFSLNNAGGSGGSAAQTVAPGGAANYPLSILPTNGTIFPAPITLSITGLPPGAIATINPSSWTQLTSTSWSFPANIALPATSLTIQTPSTTAHLGPQNAFPRNLPPILLGLLLLPVSWMRRRLGHQLGRALFTLLLLAAGASAMAGLSGCDSSSGFFGQPAQTYTMTVTATSGSLTHATTVTLTLE